MEPQPIAPEDVRPLRHRVLRPMQDEAAVVFPGDAAPGALHVGIRDAGGTLVSVGTIAPDPHPATPGEGDWRVRGMATDAAHRGSGAGTANLAALVAHARAQGAQRVWCNARVPAATLYTRAGFAIEGDVFEIEPIGPHYLMTLAL
jgi:GNAT superfamily N-acetyltransferase